ncbi:MAG TPA: hypothetical protein VFF81_08920 [Noviherbaspirillum sp.]|nr:hypothetical protein [Noviherbaspirillum sp.]
MHDQDDDYQALDYSKLSDAEIHDKLIWWWFYLLRQNDIFKTYCEAKRDGKTAVCKELEDKFKRIGELNNDWGDIHILPSMHDEESPEWRGWLAKNRHLFTVNAEKIELLTPHAAEAGSKKFQVTIPKGLGRDQLKNLFDEFLDDHPELLGAGPKYQIKATSGKNLTKILQRLDNAELVYDLVSSEDEFKYTLAEFAALVLKVPSLQQEFRWYPRGKQQDFIDKGISILSEPDIRTYSRTVKNLKDFYEACIKNTIHGEFPAMLK